MKRGINRNREPFTRKSLKDSFKHIDVRMPFFTVENVINMDIDRERLSDLFNFMQSLMKILIDPRRFILDLISSAEEKLYYISYEFELVLEWQRDFYIKECTVE